MPLVSRRLKVTLPSTTTDWLRISVKGAFLIEKKRRFNSGKVSGGEPQASSAFRARGRKPRSKMTSNLTGQLILGTDKRNPLFTVYGDEEDDQERLHVYYELELRSCWRRRGEPESAAAHKAMHSDFIHTVSGEPLYFETTDNFADLRTRQRRRKDWW